ncbi:MAG: hypothetical protein FJX47_17095 [Alphaproteobacteria bacterium]|nr:hypothetical protein [Alphaproteobacteria bacterium]
MVERVEVQKEIDDNLEFFKTKLSDLMKTDRDRYALLHRQKIGGIFDTIRDAQTAGNALYGEGKFSIQKITDQAADLGFFSHAHHLA